MGLDELQETVKGSDGLRASLDGLRRLLPRIERVYKNAIKQMDSDGELTTLLNEHVDSCCNACVEIDNILIDIKKAPWATRMMKANMMQPTLLRRGEDLEKRNSI